MKYRLAQVRVDLVAEALPMAGCSEASSNSATITQRPPPPPSPPSPPMLDPHYASARWQRNAQDNAARALRARRPIRRAATDCPHRSPETMFDTPIECRLH